ncbi:dihydrodipicolinate synthase family protein [Achromobacter xylosoxidans]
MPARPVFEGIWLPVVTPMRAGHVDCEAAQALARYYRNAGIAGLVLFGSTGEGNLLSLPEKIDMIEAIRTDPHALPLVFGAGGVDTRGVAAAIRRLDKLSPVPATWCRRRTTCARRNKASCGTTARSPGPPNAPSSCTTSPSARALR